ncbi:unnamed protein product [Lampetra planeri]
MSNGVSRRSRFGRPPARRPFDPTDRCYQCGERGHYAYDCHLYGRRKRGGSLQVPFGQSWLHAQHRSDVNLVN